MNVGSPWNTQETNNVLSGGHINTQQNNHESTDSSSTTLCSTSSKNGPSYGLKRLRTSKQKAVNSKDTPSQHIADVIQSLHILWKKQKMNFHFFFLKKKCSQPVAATSFGTCTILSDSNYDTLNRSSHSTLAHIAIVQKSRVLVALIDSYTIAISF